jgi:hypothetical protein
MHRIYIYLKIFKLYQSGSALRKSLDPDRCSRCVTPVYALLYIDLYLFTQGRGGVNWREGKGRLVHGEGQKYQHDCLYLQSINSIKHQ